MKLISMDFNDSITNLVKRSKIANSRYATVDNIEYALNYSDKERLNRILFYAENNCDALHDKEDLDKVHYLFKTIDLVKNHSLLINNLSDYSVALLATETPFEIDTDDNYDRLHALANDDFLTYVRILYPRYSPRDTICTYLQHFDERGLIRVNDLTIARFRNNELDLLDKNKNKYFSDSIGYKNYKDKLYEERGKVNELK